MAKYILKRRILCGFVQCGWGYGKKMTYGKWITLSKHETLEEALKAFRCIQGLYDKAVFYKGKRIVDFDGRIRERE